MRLLLDTNILIGLALDVPFEPKSGINAVLASAENSFYVSAASFFEIAIKTRVHKLDIGMPLGDLASYFSTWGSELLDIDHRHAVGDVIPRPATRDPFDYLLLAQCAVEDLRLVTTDRALVAHPLAWRAS